VRPAKRPTKQEPEVHSWASTNIKHMPAQIVGIIADEPDEKTAIERAIFEFQVLRTKERLIAHPSTSSLLQSCKRRQQPDERQINGSLFPLCRPFLSATPPPLMR
jgi:hypothetical protein